MSVAATSPSTTAQGPHDDTFSSESPDSLYTYSGAATSSPRRVHFPSGYRARFPTTGEASVASSAIPSLTSSATIESSKLDLHSPSDAAARKGMLPDSFVPIWKDDAGGSGSPKREDFEEMQRKDPLATQVWKLYSKAKTQLPNAERMENLTWRMMAMNLRRMELERQG